ncbi:MAG: sugar porter family MFS transporter [Acetobacteraceae bacterium]|nr:sugar porter family MFS transporter [Acetobacteraceae bacterium]
MASGALARAPRRMNSRALVVCLLAALAGLMFGLDIGVISGALDFIGKTFGVTTRTKEWIVSAMMAGAAVGALLAAPMSLRLGRKLSLIIGAVLFVAGSLCCALAPSVSVLILGRVVLGLAIGVAAFVAPLYLSEVAAAASRGSMISLYQLMITIGIFLAFVSDSLLSYTGNWRLMLGIIAVPGTVFLLGMFFVPDTPRWLMLRGRPDAARRVLVELGYGKAQAEKEIAEIDAQLRLKQQGFAMFRANPNFRRSVFLGVGLQVVQQLTGINVLMYYAPQIFKGAGFGLHAASWATAVVGLTNVLATFIAIAFVDRWGRKPILTASFLIMAVSMGVVGALMAGGAPSGGTRIVVAAMLLVFIVGFAMGAGPLVWILCAEIQPLKGRDFGIACSTFTNWAANCLVGNTFLTLLATLGQGGTFWLFAALNAAFVPFVLLYVPETRGVSLESIERRLLSGERLRRIGR